MLRLAELLAAPALGELEVVVPGDPGRLAGGVALVEDTHQLDRVPPHSFCVISRTCVEDLSGYRLDTAVRFASSGEAAALAVPATAEAPPDTTIRIAERTGIAYLLVPSSVDLGTLCAQIGKELDRGVAAALERLRRFAATLDLEGAEDPAQRVAELSKRALGADVEVTSGGVPDDRVAVEVPGRHHPGQVLSAEAGGGAMDAALEIALRVGASEVGRVLAEEDRRAEVPVRSRGLLLTELLLAPAERTEPLTHRARTLGIPIDGWHVVVRLQASDASRPRDGDEPADLDRTERVGSLALQSARTSGGTWHLAPMESAHVLVCTRAQRPDHRNATQMVGIAHKIHAALADGFPELSVRLGVGGAHEGAAGLRASAAEARAALASNADPDVVPFDAAGLRPLLVEWYASETVRESVRDLLAPLATLGPVRRQTAITTLRTYLDHEGSLTKSAEALHMHRNAVAYRVRRIFDLLGLDIDDPDQRLALHLACRAPERS